MPGPALRLLLLLLSLAAGMPISKPRPVEPEPEPVAAAGRVKENRTKSVMTKTTSPGQLPLEPSEQASLQKDHLTYKRLWEKEEFVVLKNGREFDLKSEMRASTYKNKKLLFQNVVLKLPLFQGKQANNGIRKATLPQRWLGRKKVSPALIKTRVSALVRKAKSIDKHNINAELKKELEHAPRRKVRLSAETPLQFATANLDWLARKWWWLKRGFLKAPLDSLALTVRNNQGMRGNRENNSKSRKDALSGRAARQGIRTWKLYNLRVVSKEPCKSVNSESVEGEEGKPEKDEIVLKALSGSSADGGGTRKGLSRKPLFGHYSKMGRKSLPTSLISMKTKSVVIQRTRGFGNRVILSITECVYISNGGSRDPGQRKNSTESRESIQILSRSEGQEAKSSTSDSIQEKLIFLFKATSKDRGHRVKIWSAYVRVTLKLHKRKANTFQRKIDRLVDQDGSQTDPRAPKRKPEVGPRAPELEDEGKASQGIRLEEGGGKNSWNKAQPPSSGLLHSQLYTFIIRPHFSNTVVAQGKLTTFLETSMSRLLGKNQVALSKLTGVLAAFKAIISPKSSSFRLESQQANSIRNLGEMRRLILDLWKREQTFPSVLPGDLKLRSTKPVEHEDPKVRVTSQSQKLLHDREHLPSDLLYFPGFAPSSELSKRQKRDADGFGELTQVPLGFLNHLASLLGVGVVVVAVAFIVLSIVVGFLFYKRRELFQVSRVKVVDRKCLKKSSDSTMDSRFRGVSLSRCFHSGESQVSTDKEFELQEALQKCKRRESGFVMTSITSDTSDISSNEESMTQDLTSLSASSLGSFYSQSIEASKDWFSDEEGSLCSSCMKDDLVDRVQVYLETMDAAKNFEEVQCDVTVSEDQKHLSVEKTSQQKVQVPKSVSDPLEASSGIPCPPGSRDDPSKASPSIPCLPQSGSNASGAAPDIPPGSRDDPSKAFPSIPCLPQSGSNASGAAPDIPPGSRDDPSKAFPSIPSLPQSSRQ